MGQSRRDLLLGGLGGLALAGCRSSKEQSPSVEPRALKANGAEPRNVVLVLTDDQRHDSLGFLGHPLSKTPHLDALAKAGAHLANAFVTTSLCCPSRASMLTGLYAHTHGVLDNSAELSPHFQNYAQLLKGAGVETAYIGKWHMGANNPHPRPGWDRWIAFRGQGRYTYPGNDPDRIDRSLSFDGDLREVTGYITDLLTDYAVEYLRSRDPNKPFVLVISHKGVHSPFVPAQRHSELFADTTAIPAVLPDDDGSYAGHPAWLRQLRQTEFGADHPYKMEDLRSLYLAYHRTLCAIDDSLGRIVSALDERGLSERTALLFASDNGFQFGEQGVVDKRNFYEPSIRIPMLARAPGLVQPGTRIEQLALNVDIAPTILELCGYHAPEHWHGRSLLPLLRGAPPDDWRSEFLYEYFYERAFPHTPTLFGLRTQKAKLALYHGLAEGNELYDLTTDPDERANRYEDPEWAERRTAMRQRMGRHAEALGLLLEPVWGRNWVADPEQAATGSQTEKLKPPRAEAPKAPGKVKGKKQQ